MATKDSTLALTDKAEIVSICVLATPPEAALDWAAGAVEAAFAPGAEAAPAADD
ncbi:MAG: hypothetical protein AMXMBFR13_08760 [Phycisphaerae bacterium]